MTAFTETAVTFRAGPDALLGIVHVPAEAARTGVVILVGGPQYRVGSHRMFVQIARDFARRGYPVLRFDFAGMGDSEGSFAGFERLDRDVAAALDKLGEVCATVERFVLVGLCDGATAAAYYARTDRRVAAVALLNPWVHTVPGEAKVFLWHYYPRRVLQLEFWKSLLRGGVSVGASLRDFARKIRSASGRKPTARTGSGQSGQTFVERMRDSLEGFPGRVLVVASDNDYTAAEFTDLWTADARWQAVRAAARFVPLREADHTLSTRQSMRDFCDRVADWLDGRS